MTQNEIILNKEILKFSTEFCRQVGDDCRKLLNYSYANIDIMAIDKNNDNVCLGSIVIADSNKTTASLNLLILTESIQEIYVIHNIIEGSYLFRLAEEEWELMPKENKIFPVGDKYFVVTKLPVNMDEVAACFKQNNFIENIILSEKTHKQYEKISDYVQNYINVLNAIEECSKDESLSEYKEHFEKMLNYDQQILEPLANAASVLLNKSTYKIVNKELSPGEIKSTIMLTNKSDTTISGITLLVTDIKDPKILKIVDFINGEYVTEPIPDSVADFVLLFKEKTKN